MKLNSARVKAGEYDAFGWIGQNRGVFFLCLLFAFGVMLGSFTVCKSHDNAVFSAEFFDSFLNSRQSQPLEKTFFSALTPNIIAWGAVFLCGFCAVSTPIILLILLIRAAGFGVLASGLLIFRFDAAPYYIALVLLPNTVISALALAFCCRDAVTMSRLCWESMTAVSRSDRSFLTIFCGKMLLYAIIFSGGAALEAFCQRLFLQF